MCASFMRQWMPIVMLIAILSSGHGYANKRSLGKRIAEFVSLPTVVDKVKLAGLGIACVAYLGLGTSTFVSTISYIADRHMRNEFMQSVSARRYVDEIIYYTDMGEVRVGKVVMTVQDDEGEILVLEDNSRIPIEKLRGVGHPYDHFGDLGRVDDVFFSTATAQPLNDLATRLLSKEGYIVVKGEPDYFFNDNKISVRVEHHFKDVPAWQDAEFLIDRDKILHSAD